MQTTVIINVEDFTKYTVLPIKWSGLLDERLDEGKISLRHARADTFPIGALVTINGSLDFIISADEASESPCGSGLYNHELSLIEPTKIIEGMVSESITFQNSLGRTYLGKPIKLEPVYE